MEKKLIQKLKELTGATDVASLDNNNAVIQLGEELSVSLPTIKRWFAGINAPHRVMIPIALEAIDKLIKENNGSIV